MATGGTAIGRATVGLPTRGIAAMVPTILNLPPAYVTPVVFSALKSMTVFCVDRARLFAFSPRVAYAYDLTCVNAEHGTVIRTMLHPDLSSLIDYGVLSVGSCIAAVEAQYLVHLNPTYKSTRAGLLTRQLRILSFDAEVARMHASEAWSTATKLAPLFPTQHMNRRPVLACRSHYLPNDTDDSMQLVDTWDQCRKQIKSAAVSFGEINKETQASIEKADEDPESFPTLVFPQDRPTLQDALIRSSLDGDKRGKTARSRRQLAAGGIVADDAATVATEADEEHPEDVFHAPLHKGNSAPIIGRLCAVSKLVWFGSTTSDVDYPVNFSFKIGDESRVLDITVWNKAAALYHSSLSALPLGTLIAVTGFRIKFWNGDYEGSVNMANPRGRLFIVSERNANRFNSPHLGAPLRFPLVNLAFTTTNDVASKMDGYRCSVVGVISRVGPIGMHASEDRDQLKGISEPTSIEPLKHALASDSGLGSSFQQRFAYRWIWIRDTSSSIDVAVKVFSNSRWHAFESMHAGVCAYFTHLKLVRPEESATASSVPPPFYLESTHTTSFGLADVGKPPRISKRLDECGHLLMSLMATSYPEVASFWEFYSALPAEHPWLRLTVGEHAIAFDPRRPTTASLTRPSSLPLYEKLMMRIRNPEDVMRHTLRVREFLGLLEGNRGFASAVYAQNKARPLSCKPTVGLNAILGATDSAACEIAELRKNFINLQRHQSVRVAVIGIIKGFEKVLPALPDLEEDVPISVRLRKKVDGTSQGSDSTASRGRGRPRKLPKSLPTAAEVGITATSILETHMDDVEALEDEDGIPVSLYAGNFETQPYKEAAESAHLQSYARPIWSISLQDSMSTDETRLIIHPACVLPHLHDVVPTSDADVDQLRRALPPELPADHSALGEWFKKDLAVGQHYAVCVHVYQRWLDPHAAVWSEKASFEQKGTQKPIARVEAIYRLADAESDA